VNAIHARRRLAVAVSATSGAAILGRVAPEDHVKFIQHKGCAILQIDFEGCQPPEFMKRALHARSVIASQPLSSVRTLTLVKDGRFNKEVSETMKAYTRHNKPYVRVAAVVGLSGLQEILYNVVIKVSGRKIATFSSVEAAKEFLAGHSG
jgi:hypothetical protein